MSIFVQETSHRDARAADKWRATVRRQIKKTVRDKECGKGAACYRAESNFHILHFKRCVGVRVCMYVCDCESDYT